MTRTRNPTSYPYLLEQNTLRQVAEAVSQVGTLPPPSGLWDEANLTANQSGRGALNGRAW
jgi:hypothetical protein